ncbi:MULTISPECIES: ABC transporter ATP-binding protein [Limnospira]|uniref:ABC transport system, ATP-binding component, TauB-like n=1 Tax=Limnospira indica PCC 8005 TaxID=376219 RepID=A0A9P1KGW0_9CYAN|nr:ABC transporter ATP-binding protein [Limnospira indica]CDM96080.1 ABC transport system, ATP-binding component, TauB-like [Limnospira indica PCC 8005]
MNLHVSNLYKEFPNRRGSITALENINMHIEEGEFVCAVGASGSGKSTLLRAIAGLDVPTSGEILVDGIPVMGPGPDRGMVFQHYTLYPWMNVLENVTFGLKLHGFSRSQRRQQAAYYLDIVGLSQFARAFPKELSGGMKQRVAIARALACQPKILLMDEPFGALDVQTKEVMQQFLLQIWEQTRTTILMITHDVEEAVFLSQRIYILTAHPGKIQEEVNISLPEKRTYQIRRAAKFQDYKYHIMGLLRGTLAEIPLAG